MGLLGAGVVCITTANGRAGCLLCVLLCVVKTQERRQRKQTNEKGRIWFINQHSATPAAAAHRAGKTPPLIKLRRDQTSLGGGIIYCVVFFLVTHFRAKKSAMEGWRVHKMGGDRYVKKCRYYL